MVIPAQKIIGVLALQGDFAEHFSMLKKLGVRVKPVRLADDLFECAALIIPGGESTTMSLMLEQYALREKILQFWKEKKRAIWGLCAGAILLSKRVLEDGKVSTRVKPLGLMDFSVERNAYGRQTESFSTVFSSGEFSGAEAVFIRAPKFSGFGEKCEVLASYRKSPVFLRQGRLLASSFHPELTRDPRFHEYFLSLV